MKLGSKEHYEIMDAFERLYPHLRLDHEPKDMWRRNYIYQNGEANALFLAFRQGVSFGKTL